MSGRSIPFACSGILAAWLLVGPGCAAPDTKAPLAEPTAADQDSIEACVLESAVSGHEADCIGLWSDDCVTSGRNADRCAHLESRLWVSVLLDATPDDADLPYPAMQRAIAACERAGGAAGLCERDGAASVAIPALITAEGG